MLLRRGACDGFSVNPLVVLVAVALVAVAVVVTSWEQMLWRNDGFGWLRVLWLRWWWWVVCECYNIVVCKGAGAWSRCCNQDQGAGAGSCQGQGQAPVRTRGRLFCRGQVLWWGIGARVGCTRSQARVTELHMQGEGCDVFVGFDVGGGLHSDVRSSSCCCSSFPCLCCGPGAGEQGTAHA